MCACAAVPVQAVPDRWARLRNCVWDGKPCRAAAACTPGSWDAAETRGSQTAPSACTPTSCPLHPRADIATSHHTQKNALPWYLPRATHRTPPIPPHILQLTAALRPRPTFWAARNRRSSSYQSALRCSVLSVNSASTAPSATATSFVWRGSKGARSRACRGAQKGEAWGYAAQPRHTPAVKGEQKQQSCSRPG